MLLQIPLASGGRDLAPFAGRIGVIEDGFLKVEIQPWLAEKLQVRPGSVVVVDNLEGEFRITGTDEEEPNQAPEPTRLNARLADEAQLPSWLIFDVRRKEEVSGGRSMAGEEDEHDRNHWLEAALSALSWRSACKRRSGWRRGGRIAMEVGQQIDSIASRSRTERSVLCG